MPVKKDEDGGRSVEATVEVPGEPEDVWHAIATGRGLSSWFVPSTSEEREGGSMVNSFGPGMDSVAKITAWNPPHAYVAETEEGPGKVATEWIVEARSGGTCVVRVVHRWFAETDDWDGEFEGHAYGWSSAFFRILRLYLTYFAGRTCSAFDIAAFSKSTGPQTWRVIERALKIDSAAQRFETVAGVPELSGTVESTQVEDPELLRARESSPHVVAAMQGMDGPGMDGPGIGEDPQLLLRLERPAPGLAHIFIMPMGEQTMVSLRFFLYGDEGAAAASDAERAWRAWIAERFPEEVPPSSPSDRLAAR